MIRWLSVSADHCPSRRPATAIAIALPSSTIANRKGWPATCQCYSSIDFIILRAYIVKGVYKQLNPLTPSGTAPSNPEHSLDFRGAPIRVDQRGLRLKLQQVAPTSPWQPYGRALSSPDFQPEMARISGHSDYCRFERLVVLPIRYPRFTVLHSQSGVRTD